jgi:putative endonuclease
MKLKTAPNAKSVLGHVGELLAAERLRLEGYVILERNYRSPSGELDIIAREGDVVVFVEVRTRTNDWFGHPLESINFIKQRRLRNVARDYLLERRPSCKGLRFDVVGIVMREGQEADIRIITHAFYQGELR